MHCCRVLDFSCFNKDKGGRFGLGTLCKDCQREYDKARSSDPKCIAYNKAKGIERKDINNEARRKQHQEDVVFRLSRLLSVGIYQALKEDKAERHWETLVSFTLEQLKEHLESQFTPEMTWDNMGSYWEIDHIIPKGTFSFETEKDREFQICWSLMNLRPLPMRENRSCPKDGSDIPEELKLAILNQVI